MSLIHILTAYTQTDVQQSATSLTTERRTQRRSNNHNTQRTVCIPAGVRTTHTQPQQEQPAHGPEGPYNSLEVQTIVVHAVARTTHPAAVKKKREWRKHTKRRTRYPHTGNSNSNQRTAPKDHTTAWKLKWYLCTKSHTHQQGSSSARRQPTPLVDVASSRK